MIISAGKLDEKIAIHSIEKIFTQERPIPSFKITPKNFSKIHTPSPRVKWIYCFGIFAITGINGTFFEKMRLLKKYSSSKYYLLG